MTSTVEIRGSGDEALAVRTWPAPDRPKATVLLVHGLGEHSGRYEHVGRFLTDAGYRVVGFDLPGYGQSGGRRAHATSMDAFHAPIESLVDELSVLDGPLALYGHSMGGLIALSYALADRPAPDLLVLSAPWLGDKLPSWQRSILLGIGRRLPKLEIPNPITGDELSSDPGVGEAYDRDPLNYAKTTLELGVVTQATMAEVNRGLDRLSIPTYVLHGGDDPLVPPQYTAPLRELPGVTRRLWPGLRHEAHNEPSWEAVLGGVASWLDENT